METLLSLLLILYHIKDCVQLSNILYQGIYYQETKHGEMFLKIVTLIFSMIVLSQETKLEIFPTEQVKHKLLHSVNYLNESYFNQKNLKKVSYRSQVYKKVIHQN